MKIAIGSTSPHKYVALKQACEKQQVVCEIIQFRVPTEKWNQQPVGFEQILKYAKDRATLTANAYPQALCLGIESGLIRAQDVTIDQTVIAALTPTGDWYFSTTPGIRFPERLVVETKRRGFKTTTVGQVIAEQLHGDPTDPLATLTNQALNRRYMLFTGIYVLFAQLRALGLL
ncbi:MAG: DUF84 family protein [Patescibacteria group bacterium]|jgi:non-canonical (house-cleaning) NTP pyrophosphatase